VPAVRPFVVGERHGAQRSAARVWGAPRALSRTLRLLGTVRGGTEGLELLREAAAVAATSPARLEYAKALAALGSAPGRAARPWAVPIR
jgi:hypothetical protein